MRIPGVLVLLSVALSAFNVLAGQGSDPNDVFVDLLNKNQGKAKSMLEKDTADSDARFERDYKNKARSNRSRGGLKELVFLEATKAYAARCLTDNSAILTFDRTPMGQYCGESLIDGFKCFSTPSLTAVHICK